MAEKALTLQILKQNQDVRSPRSSKDDGPGSGPPMPPRDRASTASTLGLRARQTCSKPMMLRGMTGMEGGKRRPASARGRPSRGEAWMVEAVAPAFCALGMCSADGRRLLWRAGLRNKRDDLLRAMNDVDNASQSARRTGPTSTRRSRVPVLGQI